jgi:hypothetical protein
MIVSAAIDVAWPAMFDLPNLAGGDRLIVQTVELDERIGTAELLRADALNSSSKSAGVAPAVDGVMDGQVLEPSVVEGPAIVTPVVIGTVVETSRVGVTPTVGVGTVGLGTSPPPSAGAQPAKSTLTGKARSNERATPGARTVADHEEGRRRDGADLVGGPTGEVVHDRLHALQEREEVAVVRRDRLVVRLSASFRATLRQRAWPPLRGRSLLR